MKLKIIGLSLIPILLSGCVSFKSYIIFDGAGNLVATEASIGSPSIGWEAFQIEGETEIPLIDESGFITDETVTAEENNFDTFIRYTSSNLNNTAGSFFSQENCQYGSEEEVFIQYCYNNDVEPSNILESAVIEGEWVKSKYSKEVYGSTIEVDLYTIEGELTGIAKQIFTEYHNNKNRSFDGVENFVSILENPQQYSDDPFLFEREYFVEPFGTLGIVLDEGEIVNALGDAVVDVTPNFFIIDLDTYEEGEPIRLEIILPNIEAETNINIKDSRNSNISLVLIFASLIGAAITIFVYRFRRNKNIA